MSEKLIQPQEWPLKTAGGLTGRWSSRTDNGFTEPPAIGERVLITFNGFGPGRVLGYFIEHDYLGVRVECDKRPDWHIKQNGDRHPHPMVFGAEIARIPS